MSHSNEFSMPSMSNYDPDQLFICPFDRVHRILAKRYPYHIMKCRKNHRGAKVHFCPFNARHIVPISELRHHVANCPDRSTIEPDLAYAQTQNGTDGSYMKGDTSVPSYRHDYEPTSSENWDVDDSHASMTHHPQHLHEDPNKIHSLVGMTKAQKRAFNQKLLEVHKNNRTEPDSDEESMEPEPAKDEIRRPKHLPRAALDPRQQNGLLHPVGRSVPPGPIGLGRAMLAPGQGAMPRPGTTVQGRSIAANIFNSQDTQEEAAPEPQQTGPRRAPTVAMAASTVPSAPSAAPQSAFSINPPADRMPKLAGLGRGLGVPRGGYRPGLGMPAVDLPKPKV